MSVVTRYSLRDALGLVTLVTLSLGLVHLADLVSGAILGSFRPTVDATRYSIASMVGGLSTSNRGFFIYAASGIASGMLLCCLIVPLLLLRNHWATLAAYSLPFSVLFVMGPRFWMAAVPLTKDTGLALVQPTVVASIVAACMFAFCVYSNRRVQKGAFQANAATSERPLWRKLLLVGILATYLSSSLYGWHAMSALRAAQIEAREYWENTDLD